VQDDTVGLFRIEVNDWPGGAVRILNQSPPAPFKESVNMATQNLYARSHELAGDRNPREHDHSAIAVIRLRKIGRTDRHPGPFGANLCAPWHRVERGIGGGWWPQPGGSIEPVHNPIDVVEHALSKGATTALVPISCRRGLVDLSDDVATKVQVLFHADAADALRKALHE
jgi:ATP-dependent Lon protease